MEKRRNKNPPELSYLCFHLNKTSIQKEKECFLTLRVKTWKATEHFLKNLTSEANFWLKQVVFKDRLYSRSFFVLLAFAKNELSISYFVRYIESEV